MVMQNEEGSLALQATFNNHYSTADYILNFNMHPVTETFSTLVIILLIISDSPWVGKKVRYLLLSTFLYYPCKKEPKWFYKTIKFLLEPNIYLVHFYFFIFVFLQSSELFQKMFNKTSHFHTECNFSEHWFSWLRFHIDSCLL